MKKFKITLVAAFAGILLLAAVLQSCESKQKQTPTSEVKTDSIKNNYTIDVYESKFVDAYCGRVSNYSIIYKEYEKKHNGYVVILKNNGTEINREYALKKEMDGVVKKLVQREWLRINPDSAKRYYLPKYDSIVGKLNSR